MTRATFMLVSFAFVIMHFMAFPVSVVGGDEPSKALRLRMASTFREPYIVLPNGGTAWQMLKSLETALNIEFDMTDMPAARSLSLARNGILDGGLWSVEASGDEFAHLIRVAYPLADLEVSVFSWWPNMKINSFEDLHDYYGFVASTQIGRKFLEKKIAEFENRLYVENIEQLFNLLAARRSDIVFIDRASAYEVIGDRLGKTIFEVSAKPLATLELYLYLHEKHADLIPKIIKSLPPRK